MFHLKRTILPVCVLALTVALPAPAAEPADGPLRSTLKVALKQGQGVPATGGAVPLELTFTNKTDKEQKLTNADYRIAVLNKDGEQVEGAMTVSVEMRTITLKGDSTIDRPGVFAQKGKLEPGQEYYLVVVVRNLIGHVKFIAK
jgi:hypothetical protein